MISGPRAKPPQERRILVLGKDPGSRDTLLVPLRWENWDVRGAATIQEALKLFGSWRPQIVLMDEDPSAEGATWLKMLREELPHSSVLYLSERSETDAIIMGLDQGADDYLVKPFVPLELLARMRTHMRIRDLQEQLIFANEKLKELVDIDDLTGLLNMRSMYTRLDLEIERGKRFGRGVCAIMMDMDNFKSVNDGHDHLFGSYVLSEVGKIIKASTRNIDIGARYGGDEFLVILSEVGDAGAQNFCERLRRSVEKTTFSNGEDSIRLTCSIGYAIMEPGDKFSPKELVRLADHALYEAKRSGKNRYCAHKPVPDNVRQLRPASKGSPSKPRKPARRKKAS